MPLRLADIKTLSASYWGVVMVGAVLNLARFSEAFLVLRASGTGLVIAFVPLVLVVMNVAYAASAYPAGVWADRAGRRSSCWLASGYSYWPTWCSRRRRRSCS